MATTGPSLPPTCIWFRSARPGLQAPSDSRPLEVFCVNILYPKLRLNLLRPMLGYAVMGALIAGLYGVVHDQITYSISPEYFTRLKFFQFHYADVGLPPRYFVAEIGFLATWWVGFVAGWFLARVTVPSLPRSAAFRYSLRGFLVIFTGALVASILGYIFGKLHGPDFSDWESFKYTFHVEDLPSFVRV